MSGGSVDDNCQEEEDALANCKTAVAAAENVMAGEEDMDNAELLSSEVAEAGMNGGRRRRRRTMRKSRGRRRTMRRARRRTSRRH